ncbi:lytic transglycosylase domain-containing protein [Methylobacterium durans]|uniref:lytic transglycosylase domain-containing protein n=1 Tax=Methylobacterium durans TaxID=2202825 RepID=UPI003C6D6155
MVCFGPACAEPSLIDREQAKEVLTEQLRPGATLPLVLRALRPAVQPPLSAASSPSLPHLQRLAREAATAHSVPVDYFVRLIRQESGFNHRAISRAGAQGIAQFMPATAALVGLKDPFDPVESLPKSAAFLRELTKQFGNIGLAAAAYNGGPKRVSDWLAGRGGLPLETRNYVLSITGRTAEEWVSDGGPSLRKAAQLQPVRGEGKPISQFPHTRNWELDLLNKLNGQADNATGKQIEAKLKTSQVTNSKIASGRKISRKYVSLRTAERSLCSNCLLQSSY